MKTDPQEVEQRMERFEQVCREGGIKLTHQRMEVFREVAQTGDHPDAETVHRRVRERIPTLSLDTVYRTLWLLDGLGLITTLGPPRERTRFEGNLSHHHHFVCMSCGRTRDFYSRDLDELRLPATVGSFGRVQATHVEARGVCRRCVRERRVPSKTSKKPERQDHDG